MFFRKISFFFCVFYGCCAAAYAQEDFCDAVNAITFDATNQFRNVKGNLINTSQNAITWSCGVKVPGTINSRFVSSMGLFYEGAFLQTKNKDEVTIVYEKYKTILSDCLLKKGYTLSLQDNFFPGMSAFKKVVFMPAFKESAGPPPSHITMEATYSKEVGYYTIVMYIFDH